MKRWVVGVLALGVGLCFLPGKREPFRLEYVQGEFEVGLESEGEIEKGILVQPFRFLGKGGQVYAFESEDGQWVLKLLRFKSLRSRLKNRVISWLPFMGDWEKNFVARRERKFAALFEGYSAAFRLNRETSGLVLLHFHPTQGEFGEVDLYDNEGVRHRLNLDTSVFIVQKKGRPVNEIIDEKMALGDVEGAAGLLQRLLEAHSEGYAKGLYDKDYGLIHNFGFIDDRPLHIDLGKVVYDERMKEASYQKADLERVMGRLKEWLVRHHPEEAARVLDALFEYRNRAHGAGSILDSRR